MRKTQKSKIVILSILGLAAVSIGSIGFATWLVGINRTEQELHVEAVVDDTKNDSIYLDVAVAPGTFYVAEKAPINKGEGQIVGASNTGESALKVTENALKFAYSRFEISIGKGVSSNPTAVKVEFNKTNNAFNWGAADVIKDAKYTTVSGETTNKENTLGSRRTEATLNEGCSYITYSKTFRIGQELVKDDDKSTPTYNVYYLPDLNQDFSWGTYFSGKSPAKFYNDIYKEFTTTPATKYMDGAQTFDFAGKIHQEITALNTAFTTNHTLKINASVVYGS